MSDPLHHSLLAFNFYPSQSLHSSWWTHLLTGVSSQTEKVNSELSLQQLQALNTQQPYLVSRWLLKQANIEGQFDFDFHSPDKQLLLMSPIQLQTLLNNLTACLYQPVIASLLAAKKVKAVKHLLGEQSYRFAIEQASQLSGEIPDSLRAHIVTAKALNFDDLAMLNKQLNQAAIAVLIATASHYSPALQWRLRWKLPFCQQLLLPIAVTNDDNTAMDADSYQKCRQLIQEVNNYQPLAKTA
ncbi:SctK family type III secretion system sorting platform protein [Thalassomonas viridans]|uniref:SctK family type III secretion system sorting platform protein n=1 Tax=Thalassomonas viridans TaxID=137584 RepID=A0AAF0CDC8_9GAMM|nr:SctK family type III secretion system sorting platform protein [Thalassomonas viridans]WDE08701.1 SctK family type III secretion system sorting platform protein [Thalassomonas viridans]